MRIVFDTEICQGVLVQVRFQLKGVDGHRAGLMSLCGKSLIPTAVMNCAQDPTMPRVGQ